MAKKLKELLNKAKEKFNELLDEVKQSGYDAKQSYQEMEHKFREWRDAEFKKFNEALKNEEVKYCMKHKAEICAHEETVLVSENTIPSQDSDSVA